MRNKKFFSMIAFLAVLATALACKFGVSTANIADAWMAHDEKGNQPTTTFAQDEVFYTIVDLANAPDDTTVKAIFTAVDVEGEPANTPIGEHEVTSGSGMVYFNLSNSQLWPTGKYKVDIYLNDELDNTLEFEVEASAVEAPAGVQITRAFLARDSEGTQATSVFTQDEIFYLIIETSSAPADTTYSARWIAVSAEGIEPNYLIDEVDISGGDDVYIFNLTNDQAWPVGTYRVELYINGDFVQALDFEVQ